MSTDTDTTISADSWPTADWYFHQRDLSRNFQRVATKRGDTAAANRHGAEADRMHAAGVERMGR